VYDDAREFVQQVMPQNLRKLKLYRRRFRCSTASRSKRRSKTRYERTVRLPSGGSIVIDQTEALTAIDINSARATKGGDIEETAFNTNLEAAAEIARQIAHARPRRAGGDRLHRHGVAHQREVEDKLKDAMKHDRARVQIGRISASACSRCRASACARRWANPARSSARVATATAASAASNRSRFRSCACRRAGDEGQHRPGTGAGTAADRQLPPQREAPRSFREIETATKCR
jgi:hypothetical protein